MLKKRVMSRTRWKDSSPVRGGWDNGRDWIKWEKPSQTQNRGGWWSDSSPRDSSSKPTASSGWEDSHAATWDEVPYDDKPAWNSRSWTWSPHDEGSNRLGQIGD